MVYLIEDLITKKKTKIKHLVDFAGGRGDLGLILAYRNPDITITILDI